MKVALLPHIPIQASSVETRLVALFALSTVDSVEPRIQALAALAPSCHFFKPE